MINGKKWYRSKTVWVAIFAILSALVQYLAGLPASTSVSQAIMGSLMLVFRLISNSALLK